MDLTDEVSAAKLQQQVDRDLFGEPTPAVPAGFVTDGYKLFPKTADMKPVEESNQGLGGLPQFRAKPVPAPIARPVPVSTRSQGRAPESTPSMMVFISVACGAGISGEPNS